MKPPDVTSLHAILFCRKWDETVAFYRDVLALPVLEERTGFIEFRVTAESRIALIRKNRTGPPAGKTGRGLLSLRVPDARETRRQLKSRQADLPAVREHPWGAWVMEITDPEGTRLEFWSPREAEQRKALGEKKNARTGNEAQAGSPMPGALGDRETMLDGGIPASDLTRELSREQVLEVVRAGLRKGCKPNDILFRQGDPAGRSFYVVSGRLKLTQLNEYGDEVIVRYIGPGELTAAVAVLKGKEYPVTAQVIEQAEIVCWERQTLLGLIHRVPALATSVLHIVLKRLDEVQNRFFELSTEQVEQRLARSILRIMQHAGRKTDAGIRIDFPLTRQDLAEYTGTTLYTVSRTLKGWERHGWVQSKRGQITVTDPHALVLFCEQGHARRP